MSDNVFGDSPSSEEPESGPQSRLFVVMTYVLAIAATAFIVGMLIGALLWFWQRIVIN